MTPQEIRLIKNSWAQISPIAADAARLFYQRLFEIDPTLKPLFKGDMEEQGRKLMTMLDTVVNGLERLETMLPAVRNLGRRHASYGVTDKDYQTVGAALLWTLEQGLGEQFTAGVKAAWTKAYTALADTIANGNGRSGLTEKSITKRIWIYQQRLLNYVVNRRSRSNDNCSQAQVA